MATAAITALIGMAAAVTGGAASGGRPRLLRQSLALPSRWLRRPSWRSATRWLTPRMFRRRTRRLCYAPTAVLRPQGYYAPQQYYAPPYGSAPQYDRSVPSDYHAQPAPQQILPETRSLDPRTLRRHRVYYATPTTYNAPTYYPPAWATPTIVSKAPHRCRRCVGEGAVARSVRQLGELILDAATELFLTHGFGATSIEAVAQRVRISKRTFYHRFPDKPVLFAAVVHRIIKRLRPPADIPLIEGADLQKLLERLATLILSAALSPQAIALHRLIVAESARFPELVEVFAREGATEEAIALIAGALEREVKVGASSSTTPCSWHSSSCRW